MTGLDSFADILSRFDRKRFFRWGAVARCPAHDDGKASLTIRLSPDGDLWLKCHAGCTFSDITGAVGVKQTDCFAKHERYEQYPVKDAKMKEVATYDYRDEQGQLLFQVVRFDPKDFRQRHPKPGGGWEWGLNGSQTEW